MHTDESQLDYTRTKSSIRTEIDTHRCASDIDRLQAHIDLEVHIAMNTHLQVRTHFVAILVTVDGYIDRHTLLCTLSASERTGTSCKLDMKKLASTNCYIYAEAF